GGGWNGDDGGGHVVVGMRLGTDVGQEDDLVVASDFFKGPLQIITGILEITGIPFFVCTSDASGCSDQPFAIGIVAGPANERAHRPFGLRARGSNDGRLSRRSAFWAGVWVCW